MPSNLLHKHSNIFSSFYIFLGWQESERQFVGAVYSNLLQYVIIFSDKHHDSAITHDNQMNVNILQIQIMS